VATKRLNFAHPDAPRCPQGACPTCAQLADLDHGGGVAAACRNPQDRINRLRVEIAQQRDVSLYGTDPAIGVNRAISARDGADGVDQAWPDRSQPVDRVSPRFDGPR